MQPTNICCRLLYPQGTLTPVFVLENMQLVNIAIAVLQLVHSSLHGHAELLITQISTALPFKQVHTVGQELLCRQACSSSRSAKRASSLW